MLSTRSGFSARGAAALSMPSTCVLPRLCSMHALRLEFPELYTSRPSAPTPKRGLNITSASDARMSTCELCLSVGQSFNPHSSSARMAKARGCSQLWRAYRVSRSRAPVTNLYNPFTSQMSSKAYALSCGKRIAVTVPSSHLSDRSRSSYATTWRDCVDQWGFLGHGLLKCRSGSYTRSPRLPSRCSKPYSVESRSTCCLEAIQATPGLYNNFLRTRQRCRNTS